MEHAQRVDMVENEGVIHYVLILILMEHAQRVYKFKFNKHYETNVLILILMEHAQREKSRIERRAIA